MKKIIISIAALFLIMAAIPAIVSLPKAASYLPFFKEKGESDQGEKKSSGSAEDGFMLLLDNGGEKTISEKDALTGALAALIPNGCAEEAGYAIAAATYSRLCFLRGNRSKSKTGCELCESGSVLPVYLSGDAIEEKFGADFYSLCKKYAEYGIKTSLSCVGKTLDARIFRSCGGLTDSASALLSEDIPCHESVPSPWDMTCDIKSTASYTLEEAEEIISGKLGIKNAPKSSADCIKINSAAKSGVVLTAEVCGEEKSGVEIMEAFSLSSPNFKIKTEKGAISFEVLGSGIPVGMSICGADGMARQGAERDEILSHYYPGCQLDTEDL